MSDVYPVPAAPLRAELEIKKSRFIACAFPVTTREEALSCLDDLKQEFPDARHHCWAYLIGNPQGAASAAMSDDGEPSGTAGKPILNVIQHKQVGDTLVVVVRYFGGIKLGAGGLVRAYAGATEAVLSAMQWVEPVPMDTVTLTLDFSQEQPLRHWASQHDSEIQAVTYSQCVEVVLQVPLAHLTTLHEWVNGQHGIERLSDVDE